jgi:hypothetical protein
MHRKRIYLSVAVLAVFLLLFFTARSLADYSPPVAEDSAQCSAGKAYLSALEAQDPASVVEILNQEWEQKRLNQLEERRSALLSGDVPVWNFFTDYVILGDSRAKDFSLDGFLASDRVLAVTGANVLSIESHIPDMEKLNPMDIFLIYGINDLECYSTVDSWIEVYEEQLKTLQKDFPDARLYINSVLPTTEAACQDIPAYDEIPEANTALAAMCDRLGCYYIDNDSVAQSHEDLYEPDGIHFTPQFYPYWAANMIMEVYDIEEDSAA